MIFKSFAAFVLSILLSFLLLLGNSSFASEIFSDKVLAFEIKPNVCIVKKIGQQCSLTFTVQWQTVEPMDVCLIEQQQVLQCWINEQQVDESTDVVLSLIHI